MGSGLCHTWEASRKRARLDFWWFCRFVLGDDFFNGNAEAIDNKLHRDMCRFMERPKPTSKPVSVIICPRGHLKSMIADEAHLIWTGCNDPSMRALLCHGIEDTANRMVANIRVQFETNDRLRWLYPDVIWKDPNKEARIWGDSALVLKRPWEDNVPTILAGGLEGTKAGLHYTLIKDDDLTNDQNCNNANQVEKTTLTFERHMNLLRDERSRIDFICTIWGYYDTSWYLTAKGNPMSKVTLLFQRGCWVDPNVPDEQLQPIWSQVKTKQFLLNMRTTRPSEFAKQMLCRRVLDGATVFKEADVKRYNLIWETWGDKTRPVLPDSAPVEPGSRLEQRTYSIFIAVDLNIKQSETSDYGVITAGAKDDRGHLWLLKCRRGRPTTSEMIDWIREWTVWLDPDGVIIETSAFQHSMVDQLRKDSSRSGVIYQIIEENRGNHISKSVRIRLYQNAVQLGFLHIPEGPEFDPVMEEIRGYTGAKSDHDDILDTIVDLHNRGAPPEPAVVPRLRATKLEYVAPDQVVFDESNLVFDQYGGSLRRGAAERVR